METTREAGLREARRPWGGRATASDGREGSTKGWDLRVLRRGGERAMDWGVQAQAGGLAAMGCGRVEMEVPYGGGVCVGWVTGDW